MKIVILNIIDFFNKISILLKKLPIQINGTKLYFTKIKSDTHNTLCFINSNLYKSNISIKGSKNAIHVENSDINATISIQGVGNKIHISKRVKLRKSTIIVRGNNCSVFIGEGTTFGEIRIINVGKDNTVRIGKDCLFADNIELWASDTHSIYDSEGNFINAERPVIVRDNVWIGSYTKILKGVTIGDGAIVGMNTLVTKDIDPKTLNVGNPMRCIKQGVSWTLKYENE
jgi:acetyltransferase-like isoleucine patch superfamily enzyme